MLKKMMCLMLLLCFFNSDCFSAMTEAVYTDDEYKLHVKLEKIETMISSTEYPINFPGVFEFENDTLVMVYHEGAHYDGEVTGASISHDYGKTWTELKKGYSPFRDGIEVSGIYGHLKDGTVLYMECFPVEHKFYWDKRYMPYHSFLTKGSPHWELFVFDPDTHLREIRVIQFEGLPWDEASYEPYGSFVELPNGDLITSVLFWPEPYRIERSENGPPAGIITAGNFIAKSEDKGRTWKYITHFGPYDENGKKYGSEGLSESDMALLPNGDLLLVCRTGSTDGSTIHMMISKDQGLTWSKPKSIGWPGVKPKLRVLKNGVVAITTGRGPFGHPYSTFVLFNLDGTGTSWQPPFVFYDGPSCNYTWNIEKDGKLHVYYSQSSWGKPAGYYGLEYQGINRAIIDLKLENLD